jgi:protein-disulfide isomerase
MCLADAECADKRCSDKGTCMLGGAGPKCTQDTDCQYKMCLNTGWQMVCIAGAQGTNQRCQTVADCNFDHGTCTPVAGSNPPRFVCGTSSGDTPQAFCRRDSDCVPHKVCQGQSCVVSTAPSAMPCSADADCAVKVCDYHGNCTTPSFGGYGGRCTNNAECDHLVCYVDDVGRDRCGTGGGPGVNECAADADCPRVRPPGPIAKLETETPQTRAAIQKIAQTLRGYLDGRQAYGDVKGPVDLVFVQDLTCGMCKRAFQTKIKPFLERQAKTSRVRVRFLEYPIGFFQKEAKLAEAALCAGEQNRYLAFVERVYDHKGESDDDLAGYASLLGMNAQKFNRCLREGRYAQRVRQDYELATGFGVQGTPTIFINGHKFVGYHADLNLAELVKISRRPKKGG